MVDFQKTIQGDPVEGSNQRGGFRTVDKTFWGDAVATAGKGAEVVGDSLIANDTALATAAIATEVDKVFHQSGISSELEYGIGANEVNQFKKLYKAQQNHSGNKGQLYVSRLASLTRDLRNRYPSADIDKLIEHVSGVNPYKKAFEMQQRAWEKAETDLDKWNEAWSSKAVIEDKAMSAILQANGGVIPDISKKGEIQNLLASRNAELAAKADMKEKTAESAQQWQSTAMKELFLDTSVMYRQIGKAGLQQMFDNPQVHKSMVGHLVQKRMEMETVIQSMYDTFGADVPIEELNKYAKLMTDRFDRWVKAVEDKDINLASAEMQISQYGWRKDAQTIVNRNGLGPSIIMAKELGIPDAVQQQLVNEDIDLLSREIAGQALISTGEIPSAMELSTQLAMLDTNQNRNNVMSDATKIVATFLADSGADPDRLAKVAESWLGEGRLEEASKVFNKTPIEIVNYLTQPAIIQNIAKKAPETVRGSVLKGLHRFAQSPQMQRLGNDISAYTKENAGGSIFREGTNLVEQADGSIVITKASGEPLAQTTAIQSKVAQLNGFLRNLKTANEVMGSDWDDVKNNVFLRMNLNVKTQADVSDPKKIQSEYEFLNDTSVLEVQETTMIKGPAAAIAAPLYDFEGTSGRDGYDALLGDAQRGPFKNIKPTQMTIQELHDFSKGEYASWSKEFKAKQGHGDPTVRSTPFGKYQFTGSTLVELADKMELPRDTVFTPEVQDRMFLAKLEERGWNKFLNREWTPNRMASELRAEWEGFNKYGNLVDRLAEIQQEALRG